jgi:cytochrome c oxidase subunit 1
MMIAIPTGVQIFCFLATIWNGRPKWDPPMLYIVSFILTFVMGGLTGVMIAAVPFNLQAHDTFFIVAHFHYVLIGGAVFPLLGALHYWFPKMTGRMMRPGLARLEAAIVFVGFHLTFFPMHILGLQGMTRRVYTYLPETGWGPLNALATVGAFVLSLGVLLLVANVVVSLRAPGATTAGPNPWNAGTLEWLTTSPPVDYNFGLLPVVKGPYPLWDEDPATRTWITGVATRHREVLVTTAHEARPDHRYPHPSHSIWPFWLAVATSIGFAGSVFNMWWFVVGAVLAAGPLVMWFWPDPGVRDELETRQREAEGRA